MPGVLERKPFELTKHQVVKACAQAYNMTITVFMEGAPAGSFARTEQFCKIAEARSVAFLILNHIKMFSQKQIGIEFDRQRVGVSKAISNIKGKIRVSKRKERVVRDIGDLLNMHTAFDNMIAEIKQEGPK
jgi:hypothetical protein